ncbi:MAG: AbrB/MazE/SpoVT family DNA-binding domain-containing protein [Defluviitaleaceae bacterium]|nr:AbrB/MazE/SpoVT family DNA-binding domain-containing protein [Defluviitaleaceae bacterium]
MSLVIKKGTKEPSTQNIRTVDEFGRIVLPRTVRDYLAIYPYDKFEIIMDNGNIILARHEPRCMACDDETDVRKLHRAYLCGECREAVKKTL